MSNTKRDKYDEVADKILNMDLWTGRANDELKIFLRSAFPPPAEDVLDLVDRIQEIHVSCSEYDGMEMTRDEAAAEIESFVQSRVEPWREELRGVIDMLHTELPSCNCQNCQAVRKARALLSDSPAREATK